MPFAIDRIIVIVIALGLDLVIGDPQNPFHPMRAIGNAVALGTRRYRKAKPHTPRGQYALGAATAVAVISAATLATWAITFAAYRANHWLGIGIEAVICYFCLAAKSLKVESMKVHAALATGDLNQARYNLSMIVSRDTAALSQPEIVKAAVETVAENFSDGVIAPLLFIAIGGAPLGMAYKAVNTLDSMIGYKTDEFIHFGRFAARLDDAVNFIPARFSAWMLIAASLFSGADARGAARVFARDRFNHASPNSAQTLSAAAGALGLCLGGDTSYHGQMTAKPTIGDAQNQLATGQIVKINRLMYTATLCSAVLVVAGLALAGWAAAGAAAAWGSSALVPGLPKGEACHV